MVSDQSELAGVKPDETVANTKQEQVFFIPILIQEFSNIKKLETLLLDGQRALFIKEASQAVDLLSEAARLADMVYGTFAPETFNAYMQYGRSLVYWGSNQYGLLKLNVKDEAESSEEEDEDDELDAKETTDETGDTFSKTSTEDEEKFTFDSAKISAELHHTNRVDINLDDEQHYDEYDFILKDAWEILEVAKQICERALKRTVTDVEVRKWKLNLSEVFYYLGQIMLLSDQPEKAKEEFLNALGIKQQFLSADDRELAATIYDLGKSFEMIYDFAEAQKYFNQALDILQKKTASLEKSKNGANIDSQKEIEELNAICGEIREKIKESIDSASSIETFKKNANKLLHNAPVISPRNPTNINDISNLVRKRPTDATTKLDEIDNKKSKIE